MYYPIKFSPIYKDIIWGGTNIRRRFNRTVSLERVAESWKLIVLGHTMSNSAILRCERPKSRRIFLILSQKLPEMK